MSLFQFSDPDPNYRAQVTGWDVPISTWFFNRFGQDRLSYATGKRIEEFMEDDVWRSWGQIISPEFANKLYAIPEGHKPLSWSAPVNNMQAYREHLRYKKELERQAIIEAAGSFSGRTALSFGSAFLASVSHPLDAGISFLPLFGSAARAKQLLRAGVSMPRARMAAGLLASEKSLHSLGIPAYGVGIAATGIEAMVGEGVLQIPNFLLKMRHDEVYGPEDFFLNVAAGGLFGAGFRGAIEGIARGLGAGRDLYVRLGERMREDMFRKAVNDALNGEPLKVHELASMDEETILRKIKFDEVEAKAQAQAETGRAMGDIEMFVRQQMATEGHIGRVNEANLTKIVDAWLKEAPEVDNAQTRILKKLFSEWKDIAGVPGARSASQKMGLLSNMARLVGLVFDPAETVFPETFKGQFANMRQLQDVIKEFTGAPELAKAQVLSDRLRAARAELVRFRAGEDQRLFRAFNDAEKRNAIIKEGDDLTAEIARLEQELAATGFEPGRLMSMDERLAMANALRESEQNRLKGAIEQEAKRRFDAILKNIRKDAVDQAREQALRELGSLPPLVSDAEAKAFVIKEAPTDADAAAIEASNVELARSLGIPESEVARTVPEPGKAAAKTDVVEPLAVKQTPSQQDFAADLFGNTYKEPTDEMVEAAVSCLIKNS